MKRSTHEIPQVGIHERERGDEAVTFSAEVDVVVDRSGANLSEIYDVQLDINSLKQAVRDTFDEGAALYLENVDEQLRRSVLRRITELVVKHFVKKGDLIAGHSESGSPFNAVEVYNMVSSESVRGYGSPEVRAREATNIPPTAQELLMGCFAEQLERQTRSSVLALRAKGYNTIESGYRNKERGSQFFHLIQKEPAVVPEALRTELFERFGIEMTDQRKLDGESVNQHIELLSERGRVVSLEEWEHILDFFAAGMPAVGEATFVVLQGSSDFAWKTREHFTRESLLATATSETERALIDLLYNSTSLEEFADAVGVRSNKKRPKPVVE